MKKQTKRYLLDYLRERFRETLMEIGIDIIQMHKDHFSIGFPTSKNSGTEFFNIYPTPNGMIKVTNTYWDESFKKDELERLISSAYFTDIDAWMFNDFEALPSARKSRKIKDYRRVWGLK